MSLKQLAKEFKNLSYHRNSVQDYDGYIRQKHHVRYLVVHDYDHSKGLKGLVERSDAQVKKAPTPEDQQVKYTRLLKALSTFLENEFLVVWRTKPHVVTLTDSLGNSYEEIYVRLVILDIHNRL